MNTDIYSQSILCGSLTVLLEVYVPLIFVSLAVSGERYQPHYKRRSMRLSEATATLTLDYAQNAVGSSTAPALLLERKRYNRSTSWLTVN